MTNKSDTTGEGLAERLFRVVHPHIGSEFMTRQAVGEIIAVIGSDTAGLPSDHYIDRTAEAIAALSRAPVAVTRTDILREWFGSERYARDYEYLDANFGRQAEQVVAYLTALSEQWEAAQPAADGWRRGDYVVYDNGFGPVTARILGYVEGWINLGFSDGSSEICRPSRISRLASQAEEDDR